MGLVAVMLMSAAGCGSTRSAYRPSTLPPEFQAQEVRNPNDYLALLPMPMPATEIAEPGDLIDVLIDPGTSTSPGNAWVPRPTPVSRRVGDDGTVWIEEIGKLKVAGLRLPDVEQRIQEAAQEAGVFPRAGITVTMKQKKMYRVGVYGAVKAPNAYELPCSMSVLAAALLAAGGLSEEASSIVEIRPGSAASAGPGGPMRLDLSRPIDPDVALRPLEDGSRVIVHRQPLPEYVVSGQVQKPDVFKFPVGRRVRLSEAISKAGGTTQPAIDDVTITRLLPDGRPITIRASLQEAKGKPAEDLAIQPGDTINVEHNTLSLTLDTLKRLPVGIGATIPLVP